MRSAAFLVPGNLDTRTGGYIYDRHIVEGLRERGWTIDVIELSDSFPFPAAEALRHAAEALAGLADGTVVLADGLAYSAMPDVAAAEAARLLFVPIVHLPLAQDVGLEPRVAARLEADERRALAAARLIVVTGAPTVGVLSVYGLPSESILLVEPGTDPAPIARGSGAGPGTTVALLCVATLSPGKGHAILLRALAATPHRQWHLTCAGSLTRHAGTLADVRRLLVECDLEDHVSLPGELHEKGMAECYDRADVFVLPTLRETYGMAVAEALARGLPVVSTMTGAIPSLVGSDAGLLVPPGDEPAFTDAIAQVLVNPDLRRRLARGAQVVREQLPGWDVSLDKIATALAALEG